MRVRGVVRCVHCHWDVPHFRQTLSVLPRSSMTTHCNLHCNLNIWTTSVLRCPKMTRRCRSPMPVWIELSQDKKTRNTAKPLPRSTFQTSSRSNITLSDKQHDRPTDWSCGLFFFFPFYSVLPQPHASTKLFMFCATGWLLEQTVGEGQVSPTYLHLYICRYVVGRREGGRYPKHGRNPRCRSCWFTTTEKISNAADVSAQSAREGGGGGQQVTLQAIQ